jgi:phosphatidate cytidylyltransferase
MPRRDKDRPEESVEDLFEDLDKFFEPIREPDWPQGAPGQPQDPGPIVPEEAVPTEEGWPEITVPDEAELLGEGTGAQGDRPPELTVDDLKKAPPEYADLPGPADQEGSEEADQAGPVEAAAKGRGGEKPARTHKRTGSKRATRRRGKEPEAPPEPEVPDEAEAGAEEADEEALAAEFGMLEEAVSPEEPIEVLDEEEGVGGWTSGAEEERPVTETEEPDLEAVEAAAEHFAEGLRSTPEEVEADLLADLEVDQQERRTVSIEPGITGDTAEAPSGTAPSWQEPGMAVAETEEVPPPPSLPGRNLVAAFTTGLILAALALALLMWGKLPFAVLAAAVILLGQGELYAVMRMRGRQPATALGLVAGLVTVAGGYAAGEAGVLLGMALAMLTSVLWYMAAPQEARKGTTIDVGATLLGVVYVPFLASFGLVMLREDVGRNLLLAVVGLTVLYDILAYAIGSLWGNRALAPTISPSKSWEGAVGATLGILLVAIALVPSVEPFTPTKAVGLALLIAVFAPIGDLVESALKRDLGVKDMSSILPGHGGILDRIDSILFTLPAAWYFIRLVF